MSDLQATPGAQSDFDGEDDWQDALEDLATELGEPDSDNPLSELIASIDAAVAADVGTLQPPSVPRPELWRKRRLVFSVAGERYSAPLDRILRLDRLGRLTPVPNTPAFLLGVANVSGEIVPALDLRRLWGLPANVRSADRRLMQIRSQTGEAAAGLVVDALHGIRDQDADEAGGARALDVDALLNSAPVQALMRGGE
jgi:chemotaxis signal transduction protein